MAFKQNSLSRTANQRASTVMGRPLLVTDPSTQGSQILSRAHVPPEQPVRFLATEPFTILGIKPRTSAADIVALAKERGKAWLELIPEDWNKERQAVLNAMDMLKDRRSCMEYRGFAKKYAGERPLVSRKSMQKRIAKTIVLEVPGLKNRQKLRDLKSGGLFGISFLTGFILLIAVLTVEIGGIAILGFTLFGTTLAASWGPLAFLPAGVIAVLGAMGAYWYMKHKAVFRELQGFMHEIIERMEVEVQAADDLILLHAYRHYQQDCESYIGKNPNYIRLRKKYLDEMITEWVRNLIEQLGGLVQQVRGEERMRAEDFFEFLSDHPGEVREAFEHTVEKRITAARTPLGELSMTLNQGQ